jgi:hypothetical protein
MKLLYFIILIFILVNSVKSIGQTLKYINIDTADCKYNRQKVDINTSNDFNALKWAEKYIVSIVGKAVAKKIWFSCYTSKKSTAPRYSSEAQIYRRIGYYEIFQLYFYVLDNGKMVGNFDLFVDSVGTLENSELGCQISNRPELIRGFKKYFENNFKFGFEKALELGKQKGFQVLPILECKLESLFKTLKGKNEYLKLKYYWRFQEIKNGGDMGILEVDTEDGKIIKQEYSPRMPR